MKNTKLGPGVHVYTPIHKLNPIERRTGLEFGKPVKIRKDCWIGSRVVICPDIIIGNDITIGAGSVVTKDVPDNVVIVGNPAKIIEHIKFD